MSEDTVRVRVTGRQFRHGGEEYHHGDELEVPERAIEGWEGRLERVESDGDEEPEGDEDDGGEDEAEVGVGDVDPHPQELTVGELSDRLEGVDDAATVRAIQQAEAESDEPRTTALEAIDARLDELEG